MEKKSLEISPAAVKMITEILSRGNDAIVRRRKDSYIILEEKKEIKYSPLSDRR